jgi:hypothetical protein
MKRITMIFTATLALALLVYAQNRMPQVAGPASLTSTAAAFQSQKIKFPKISISLTFGRAKKNCAGWGICKISIGKLSAAPKGRTVPAELSRTDDGKLELRVLERSSEEGPTFFVDEDVPLSAEIAKQLGVKNATIQRGEYSFSASKSVLNARLTK